MPESKVCLARVSGAGHAGASADFQPAANRSVAAGVTRWLTVEFTPGQSGLFQGTLTLTRDDASRPVVEVPLLGSSR